MTFRTNMDPNKKQANLTKGMKTIVSEKDIKEELEKRPIFLPSNRRDKGIIDDLKALDPNKYPALVLDILCTLIQIKDSGSILSVIEKNREVKEITALIKEKINESETKNQEL